MPLPVATTEKLVEAPAETVCDTGWVVMLGAVTVLPELLEPEPELEPEPALVLASELLPLPQADKVAATIMGPRAQVQPSSSMRI